MSRVTLSVRRYAWPVFKNVLGWLLIIASLVLGPLVPGPGGLPLFALGFALVTFPGKRHLTARVMRGRPIRFPRGRGLLLLAALALAAASLTIWLLGPRQPHLGALLGRGPWGIAAAWLLAWVLWAALFAALLLGVNALLRVTPPMRRRFRPWLRRRGMRLSPPRRRRRRRRGRGKPTAPVAHAPPAP